MSSTTASVLARGYLIIAATVVALAGLAEVMR